MLCCNNDATWNIISTIFLSTQIRLVYTKIQIPYACIRANVAVLDFGEAFDVVRVWEVAEQAALQRDDERRKSPLRSFLSGSSQQVVADGETSDTAPVTSGDTQGSDLGPILLLTFIQDVSDAFNSKCGLFSDRGILSRGVKTSRDADVSGTVVKTNSSAFSGL